MFRYSLRSLLILTGVGPPAIALFWFGWRALLMLAVVVALLALWILVSLALARTFARLIASVVE